MKFTLALLVDAFLRLPIFLVASCLEWISKRLSSLLYALLVLEADLAESNLIYVDDTRCHVCDQPFAIVVVPAWGVCVEHCRCGAVKYDRGDR